MPWLSPTTFFFLLSSFFVGIVRASVLVVDLSLLHRFCLFNFDVLFSYLFFGILQLNAENVSTPPQFFAVFYCCCHRLVKSGGVFFLLCFSKHRDEEQVIFIYLSLVCLRSPACNWMRRQLFKLNELHLCDKINAIQSNPIKQCKFKWSRCRIKHFKSCEWMNKKRIALLSLKRAWKLNINAAHTQSQSLLTLSDNLQFAVKLKSSNGKQIFVMNGE